MRRNLAQILSLILLVSCNNLDKKGIIEDLPNVDVYQYEDVSDSKEVFKVYLKSNEKIIYNDSLISYIDLKNSFISFVKEHQSNTIIDLKSDKETSYSFYNKINKMFYDEVIELRNKESLTMFDISYSDLSKAQKIEIKKRYPFNIK